MCNNSCGNTTIIKFKKNCSCSGNCNCINTTNNINFGLPDGGEDGQVLAKNGDSLIWVDQTGGSASVDFDDITLIISSNGQTLFSNAIPENKNLHSLYVNGIRYYLTKDFTITGRNINWLNTDGITLETTDNFTITVI